MNRHSRPDEPATPGRGAPPLDRTRALARAIATIPCRTTGLRRWVRVDAIRRDDHWACLLEDDRCRYALTVHAHTAAVHISRIAWLQPPPAGPRRPRIIARATTCRPADRKPD